MTAKVSDGILVECIHCKARRLLSFEEARALTEPPFCDKCFMPMVAIQATVSRKESTS